MMTTMNGPMLRLSGHPHPRRASPRLRGAATLASLAGIGVMATGSSSVASTVSEVSGRAAGMPVVHPGQSVHLAGTDIYGEVKDTNQGVGVYGELFPPGAKRATGYFFVAQDGGLAVGKLVGGAPHYVFTHAQPAVHLALAPAGSGSGVVTVRLGWVGRVGGTALVLTAGPDKAGHPALVADLGSGGAPANGTYLVGITERGVAVGHWQGGSAKLVYQVIDKAAGTPAETPTTTASSTSPTKGKTPVGKLGTSLTINGIRATLVAVSNNARPRTVYDTLPSSSEIFDTATVKLTNLTSSHLVGASNAEIAMVGTDNKTYTPDIDYAVAGCEDFGSGGATGTLDIPPGSSETGCVHFVVPAGVKVALIGFSPGAQWVAGGYVAWTP